MLRARMLLAALTAAWLVHCSAQPESPDAGPHDSGRDVLRADAPTNDLGPDSQVGSQCFAATTCGACAMEGCGWCLTANRCLPGDSSGSTDGSCIGAAWDFTGDLCATPTPDAGVSPGPDSSACVPTVAVGGENSNALCSDGIDNDCNGYADCNDYGCSRNPAVTVCRTTRDAGTTCVPTVSRGHEDTNALCGDGIDNDCNGYTDCNDYGCSRTASVTVCADGGTAVVDSGAPPPPPVDAGAAGPIGPTGGTVGLLHFAVFGDVRPPANNDTSGYPSAIVGAIMANFRDLGAQFSIATGDYMFATTSSAVTTQIGDLLNAETMYGGYVFHGMGNHECTGGTASNCPNGNETPNAQDFMSRLNAGHTHPYFDWTIHTSLGDAHFISTAPNAWSTAQQSWLSAALSVRAAYTFVLAHEPPTGTQGPGSSTIDSIVAMHSGVTIRFYGHTHEYRHISGNMVINGNAGAPLAGTGGSGDYYGFGMVDQRPDGNMVFTAYQMGTPPMPLDSFVVTPSGTLTH